MYAVLKPPGFYSHSWWDSKPHTYQKDPWEGQAEDTCLSPFINKTHIGTSFLSSTTSRKYMCMQVHGLNVQQVSQASLRPTSPSLDCRLFLQRPQLVALARGARSSGTMETGTHLFFKCFVSSNQGGKLRGLLTSCFCHSWDFNPLQRCFHWQVIKPELMAPHSHVTQDRDPSEPKGADLHPLQLQLGICFICYYIRCFHGDKTNTWTEREKSKEWLQVCGGIAVMNSRMG